MNKLIMGISFLLIFGFNGILSSNSENLNKNNKTSLPPQTVSEVDLNRYLGLWYEITKIPNRFQKKCFQDTTAEYKMRSDGRIDVINRCFTKEGKEVVARGIAKSVEPSTNSKLKVSFVRVLGVQLFWGDYWIIGLDKNYRYAVIGGPNRKYGWILSRRNSLSPEEWKEVKKILIDQGYDPNRFVLTPHTK